MIATYDQAIQQAVASMPDPHYATKAIQKAEDLAEFISALFETDIEETLEDIRKQYADFYDLED